MLGPNVFLTAFHIPVTLSYYVMCTLLLITAARQFIYFFLPAVVAFGVENPFSQVLGHSLLSNVPFSFAKISS